MGDPAISRGRYVLLAAASLAGSLPAVAPVSSAFAQERADRVAQREVTLRPDNRDVLAAIEIVEAAAGRSQPLTDLVLHLRAAAAMPLATALGLADGVTPKGQRVLFHAELIVAAGGRILYDRRAECGPWRESAAVCAVSCDGGAFVIARKVDHNGAGLALLLGQHPAATAEGFESGARLGVCREGATVETALQPAAGKPLATISLVAE